MHWRSFLVGIGAGIALAFLAAVTTAVILAIKEGHWMDKWSRKV